VPEEYDRQQHERGAQDQSQPGLESQMDPQPVVVPPRYRGSGKLEGRAAVVTGGDSGIGRSAAALFAIEGADVAVAYLEEHGDAEETKRLVEAEGRRCVLIPGDLRDEAHCQDVVRRTVSELGRLDTLVNHAGEQHVADALEDITAEQLERTFETNVFAMFHLTKAALPHLGEGSAIVNTTSVTAYEGHPMLVDYSATNGAIVSFTRALAKQVADRGIRVNGVAPGPVWTPLIPATFPPDQVQSFGDETPMGRAGQPAELGPAYVYLASDDSSFMTGQVLHVNGGKWMSS
jgi:NAD(P)-dependent dehydrogenase (short-subunit alcohol dehydrogenase family)